MEIWKQIAKAPEFEISNTGVVRRISDHRVYKWSKNKRGYSHVNLPIGNKRKVMFVHQLLATAFIDNPYNKPLACFKNNDRSVVEVDNLVWMTEKEKAQHCIVNGYVDYKSIAMKACIVSNAKTSKPIMVIDEETGEQTLYKSTSACISALGVSYYNLKKMIAASA